MSSGNVAVGHDDYLIKVSLILNALVITSVFSVFTSNYYTELPSKSFFPPVDLIVCSLVNLFCFAFLPALKDVLFLCTVSLQAAAPPAGLLPMSRLK